MARKKKNYRILTIVVSVVVVAVIVLLYSQHKNTKTVPKVSQTDSPREARTTVEKVGALMLLPEGENPTVATVKDKATLASQVFFKNAEDGDKILIYPKAKIAIIYRPSINKIVNVAPLFQEQAAANN